MVDLNPRDRLDAALCNIGVTPQEDSPERFNRPQRASGPVLDRLPGAPPCHRVEQQRAAVAKALADGPRHLAVTGPLVKLLGLARDGHFGIAEAVGQVGEQFVAAIAADRGPMGEPGGRTAKQEWERLLAGAVAETLKSFKPRPHRACDCELADLEQLAGNDAIYTPRRKRSQRNVYRALVRSARLKHSLRVTESYRQLELAAQVGLGAVKRAVGDLQKSGLITKVTNGSATTQWILTRPRTLGIDTALPPLPPLAGTTAVSISSAVHPLFGPQGLRGGHLRLYEVLPELWVPTKRGWLVAVGRGTSDLDPHARALRSPDVPSGRAGPGMTVQEISTMLGSPRSTVRAQLNLMRERGLAVKRGTRWHRARVADADAMMVTLGITDTRVTMQQRQALARLAYWRRRASFPDGVPGAAVEHVDDTDVTFLDRKTKEILWSVSRSLVAPAFAKHSLPTADGSAQAMARAASKPAPTPSQDPLGRNYHDSDDGLDDDGGGHGPRPWDQGWPGSW